MAESSLNLTMTERGQNHQRTEAAKCNNLLLAQKKLLTEKITRCKEMIRHFHLSEDSGLSITDIALEIGPAYSKIRADLGLLVENWNEFIRQAVISKDPQPVTVEERENLKREIDQQNEKIDDYMRSLDIIKLDNLDTFKKIENNSKSFQHIFSLGMANQTNYQRV